MTLLLIRAEIWHYALHMYAHLFFGPPGAGKGTQQEMLENNLVKRGETLTTFGVGSLLRELVGDGDTVLKRNLKEVMDNGGLVPSAFPIAQCVQYLSNQPSLGDHLMIEGLARKYVEAEVLIELLLFLPEIEVNVFLLNVPKEEVMNRLKKRGRVDDKEDIIEHRFVHYNNTTTGTTASIKFLQSHPETNFYEVDGTGTPEEVHQRVLTHIT